MQDRASRDARQPSRGEHSSTPCVCARPPSGSNGVCDEKCNLPTCLWDHGARSSAIPAVTLSFSLLTGPRTFAEQVTARTSWIRSSGWRAWFRRASRASSRTSSGRRLRLAPCLQVNSRRPLRYRGGAAEREAREVSRSTIGIFLGLVLVLLVLFCRRPASN